MEDETGKGVEHVIPFLSSSFLSCFVGGEFCVSRKGGTGGGGWVHPKGANSMAASGLVFRSDLVGTGRAISILFGINGVRNQRSHLVGPPFPESTPFFSYSRLAFLERLN